MKSLNKQTNNAVISRLNTIHSRNLELLQDKLRKTFPYHEDIDEIVSEVYTEFRKTFVFSKPKSKVKSQGKS